MIVLLAVTEKQVVLTDNLATAPIAGRASIFNRVTAPTETRFDIEIVGAYTNLDTCARARELHAQTHPHRRYIQKVCALDDNLDPPNPDHPCVRCGTNLTGPTVFCQPCTEAHAKELRDADPDLPTEPEPVRMATAGMETRFRVTA